MAANQSKDELERLFYERALAPGGGFGSDVNVTNNPLRVTPTDELGTGTAVVNVGNFPAAEPYTGLKDSELRAAPVEVLEQNPLVGFSTEVTLEALRVIQASIESITTARLPRNAEQYAQGLYRNAGGKQVVESASTGVLSIQNPVGSGKLITITEFTLAATTAADVTFHLDGTVNGPTAISVWTPNRAVGGATSAVAQRGATGVTGGTAISPVYRVPADIPIRHEFVVTLAPGQSVAALLTTATLATNNFYAGATWIEESL